MYSKFEYDGKLNPTFEMGNFELPVANIKAYLKDPIKPRFWPLTTLNGLSKENISEIQCP